jgi:prophage regulatory protein
VNGRVRILRVKEVAELVGVSTTTLWRWQRDGLMPKRRQIGPNVTGWTEQEITEWLEDRPRAGDTDVPNRKEQ